MSGPGPAEYEDERSTTIVTTQGLTQLELSVLSGHSRQWTKGPGGSVDLLHLDLVRLVTVEPHTRTQPEERSDSESHPDES